ncbi:MAG: potassium transporter [Desulfobacterium sp.]|nr:potassium transporter [Desulfobacterium sp.]
MTEKNLRPIITPIMETIWIIGAGHFGRLAVNRLRGRKKARCLVVVDPVAKNLEDLQAPGEVFTVIGDGIDFLDEHLKPGANVDWVIPSLPLHLGWKWCQRRLGPSHLVPLPAARQELLPLVPNPMEGTDNDLYTSFADFICPDNCSEPSEYCTATGLPRKQNLFDLLGKLQIPGFRSLVLQSHQLCPGIGGVTPDQLFSLLADIEAAPGKLLISTACRCHGVITPSLYTQATK